VGRAVPPAAGVLWGQLHACSGRTSVAQPGLAVPHRASAHIPRLLLCHLLHQEATLARGQGEQRHPRRSDHRFRRCTLCLVTCLRAALAAEMFKGTHPLCFFGPLQVRQWALIAVQTGFLVLNAFIILNLQHSASFYCTHGRSVVGLEALFSHVRLTLQLPWDSAVSRDACIAEAGLRAAFGESWTTRAPYRQARSLSGRSGAWARPLACSAPVVMPELTLRNSSTARAIGDFRAYSMALLQGEQNRGVASLSDVARQISTVPGAGPSPLRLHHALTQATSASTFATMMDAEMQLSGGNAASLYARSLWLQCAVRSGASTAEAEADCLLATMWKYGCTALALGATLLRVRRLADMAEEQSLVLGLSQWMTSQDKRRSAELRARTSAGRCRTCGRLACTQIAPAICLVVYFALAQAGLSHPCADSMAPEAMLLGVTMWFLPAIVSDGLLRNASVKDLLGLRLETTVLTVLCAATVMPSLIAKQYAFQFVSGFVMLQTGLAFCGIVMSLAAPAHWAAVPEWTGTSTRWVESCGSGKARSGGTTSCAAVGLSHLLAVLDNMVSPCVLVREASGMAAQGCKAGCVVCAQRWCVSSSSAGRRPGGAGGLASPSSRQQGDRPVSTSYAEAAGADEDQQRDSDEASVREVLRHPGARVPFLEVRSAVCARGAIDAGRGTVTVGRGHAGAAREWLLA